MKKGLNEITWRMKEIKGPTLGYQETAWILADFPKPQNACVPGRIETESFV